MNSDKDQIKYLLDHKQFEKFYKFLTPRSNIDFVNKIQEKQLIYSKKYFPITHSEIEIIKAHLRKIQNEKNLESEEKEMKEKEEKEEEKEKEEEEEEEEKEEEKEKQREEGGEEKKGEGEGKILLKNSFDEKKEETEVGNQNKFPNFSSLSPLDFEKIPWKPSIWSPFKGNQKIKK